MYKLWNQFASSMPYHSSVVCKFSWCLCNLHVYRKPQQSIAIWFGAKFKPFTNNLQTSKTDTYWKQALRKKCKPFVFTMVLLILCTCFIYSLLITYYYFRTILACLHFNENVQRKTRTTKTGKTSLHVSYPKFKFGEEVVREIAISPTYGESILLYHQ